MTEINVDLSQENTEYVGKKNHLRNKLTNVYMWKQLLKWCVCISVISAVLSEFQRLL